MDDAPLFIDSRSSLFNKEPAMHVSILLLNNWNVPYVMND